MKYIKYIQILVWTLVRKIIGVPVTLMVLPFRGYANNRVFNYVLDNGVYLKRLLERPITSNSLQYVIHPYHGTKGGYVERRKVSRLEYLFAYYFIWQWLDADSNQDTFDAGYNMTIISKERYSWFPQWVRDGLQESNNKVSYGNTFDLGDKRVSGWKYEFLATLLWSIRNTAYNSKYMTFEKEEGDPDIFLIGSGKYRCGWEQDTNCPSNYSLVVFGIK